MLWLVLLFVLALVVVGVLRYIAEQGRLPGARANWYFVKAPPLFSPAERSFYGVLEQAIGGEYRVFAKVRLGDVIQPHGGMEKSPYFSALNKINKKHLDFVVCGKTNFVVVGAIELDDKSHDRRDRQERDAFVDQALASAGIPILHFSAKAAYSVQDVRVNIANAFSLTLKGEGEESSVRCVSVEESGQPVNGLEFKLISDSGELRSQQRTEQGGARSWDVRGNLPRLWGKNGCPQGDEGATRGPTLLGLHQVSAVQKHRAGEKRNRRTVGLLTRKRMSHVP